MRILVWLVCGYFFLSALATVAFVYPDAWPTPVDMTCAEAVVTEDLPLALRLSECEVDPLASLVVEEKFILDKGPGERVGGFLALAPPGVSSQGPRLFLRSDGSNDRPDLSVVLYRESTGDSFGIERELGIDDAVVLNPENTQPAGFIVLFSLGLAVVSLTCGLAYELSNRRSAPTSSLSALRGD